MFRELLSRAEPKRMSKYSKEKIFKDFWKIIGIQVISSARWKLIKIYYQKKETKSNRK
jgi:hypothetical protein